MTRFYGKIGYSEGTVETPPGSGVYKDTIVERPYYGDVLRNTRQIQAGEKVNSDLAVNNSISVVADAYALQNILAMRYIEWLGALWITSDVTVSAPRLIIQLGGVYNGPRPAPSGP